MTRYDLANLGLTEAELLDIRAFALSDLKKGKVVTSTTIPGLASTFQVYANPLEILKAVTYALQVINPTRYGARMQTVSYGYTN